MKRLLIKVCGMTRPEDARLAAALGADMLGFIFHPGSPRNVDPAFPAGLDKALDLRGALKVGVFLRQSAEEVLDIMAAGGLDLAQLHGGQDEEFCRRIGPERVVKVLWPEKAASAEELARQCARFGPFCRLFLFDAGGGGGGHGRGFDPALLRGVTPPRPWLLAGGLGPDNACGLVQALGPDGADINSGVENAPGIKDANKLRQTLTGLRALKTKGVNP